MKYLYLFNASYLTVGGIYFLQDLNFEFVIYVGVIIGLLIGLFYLQRIIRFPLWMLWLFSIWGLMHVLGGMVPTPDGVLFAYRIYPFLDLGGDFYILKYDQVVHAYLYGVQAIMYYYIIRSFFGVKGYEFGVWFLAALTSLGFSGLNEIMEFLIAISLERNGVGGYENAMLDLIFNFSGAVIALALYTVSSRRKQNTLISEDRAQQTTT